ncbi:MAG: DNA translocase FtsK 4TM domain-containing protein [Candidatus Aenigmatarchaeota archaeon]
MKTFSSFLKSAIFFSLSIILFLSFISYKPTDIGFLVSPKPKIISNLVGIIGAYLGFFFFFIFGYTSYFLPIYFFILGFVFLKKLRSNGLGKSKFIKFFSFILFFIFLASFLELFFEEKTLAFKFSGLTGYIVGEFFKKYLGFYGSVIIFLLIIFATGSLLFTFLFLDLGIFIKESLKNLIKKKKKIEGEPILNKKLEKTKDLDREESSFQVKKPEIKVYIPKHITQKETLEKEEKIKEKETKEEIKKKIEELEKQTEKKYDSKTYKLPSIEILKTPPLLDYREVKESIEANIKNLEETLLDFDVEAKVVSVQKGPVVTMYELQPSPGVKIQKISVLADDIALAMKSSSVRIVAPIPGRGTIGVEVPNEKKHLVYLREVLEEKTFINSTSKLTLAIGKDVSGSPVIADLTEMPHLLIAGTTGSGKTVCVNSLIASIIFKAKPDEVRFILIDPKMVELAIYAGIPHLLHPIISEAKKAFIALNWAVGEMERRYQILAQEGVRNIEIYNKSGKNMPYIVIVIDELADLMVVARENIETAIQRLAQLSRAVGIHLILATQRPSVDVITGVIKANFPARISFKVSSKVDSRTVLDTMGAEKLLGKGDLLFLKPGASRLIRAQGSFIDDEDITALTNFIRAQGAPIYEEAILEGEKLTSLNIEEDELFDEAVRIVLQARQASASILQRRLRVGYTRAARLLDLMEQKGLVGPFCGSKAREILVDPEKYMKEKGWL